MVLLELMYLGEAREQGAQKPGGWVGAGMACEGDTYATDHYGSPALYITLL
jgi:hypothetical protein